MDPLSLQKNIGIRVETPDQVRKKTQFKSAHNILNQYIFWSPLFSSFQRFQWSWLIHFVFFFYMFYWVLKRVKLTTLVFMNVLNYTRTTPPHTVAAQQSVNLISKITAAAFQLTIHTWSTLKVLVNRTCILSADG